MSWAISMLPMAESVGRRLKRWKTKPILARRIRVRSASESLAKSMPSIRPSRGGVGEAAENVEEGRFSGAGGADDGDELARSDGEVDVAEGGDLEFAGAVGFAEVLGEDDWGCGGIGVRRGGQALSNQKACKTERGIRIGWQRGRMRKH